MADKTKVRYEGDSHVFTDEKAGLTVHRGDVVELDAESLEYYRSLPGEKFVDATGDEPTNASPDPRRARGDSAPTVTVPGDNSKKE